MRKLGAEPPEAKQLSDSQPCLQFCAYFKVSRQQESGCSVYCPLCPPLGILLEGKYAVLETVTDVQRRRIA